MGVRRKRADGGVHGMAAWVQTVLVMEATGEPFAEAFRSNGQAVIPHGTVGNDGPGLTEGSAQRGGEFQGMVEELFGSGFVHKVGPRFERRGWGERFGGLRGVSG